MTGQTGSHSRLSTRSRLDVAVLWEKTGTEFWTHFSADGSSRAITKGSRVNRSCSEMYFSRATRKHLSAGLATRTRRETATVSTYRLSTSRDFIRREPY